MNIGRIFRVLASGPILAAMVCGFGCTTPYLPLKSNVSYVAVTVTVTYSANPPSGSNFLLSGNVPIDSNHYQAGAAVTVLDNTGKLS
jgi:hypothetical protein